MNLTEAIIRDFEAAIEHLIIESELIAALDQLIAFTETHRFPGFNEQAIVLRANASKLRKEERLGVVSYEDLNKSRSKLTLGTKTLTDDLCKFALEKVTRIKLQGAYTEVEGSVPAPVNNEVLQSVDDWNEKREFLYKECKEILMVHTLWPSEKAGQDYDIYIYLTAHKGASLDTVGYAEFFMGKHFHNKVFKVKNTNNKIGIYTSAYGPFLCLCRITYRSGEQVFVSRYIDFEQGDLLQNQLKGKWK